VQYINRTRPNALGVRQGKGIRSSKEGIHIDEHVQQTAPREHLREPTEPGVALLVRLPAVMGSKRVTLVERTLENSITDLQVVDREEKQGRFA